MSQPTIVFVPGAFHTPEYYNPVRALLEAKGYGTEAVSLPSVGNTSASPMTDDVTAIRAVTSRLADEGHQVVLVMHSYGGIPGTESAKELGCGLRRKAGKTGGIVALVYLAAYFLKKGMSHSFIHLPFYFAGSVRGFKANTHIVQDGLIFHDKPAALETLYNDFTPEMDPKGWASRLQTQSAASWAGELSYESYRDIPTTYLLCTRDRAIPIDIQRNFVGFAEGHISTVTCEAGHSPMISMPEVVIDVIIRAAEALQGEE
ncbi:Alpha/beta hydrolase fold-1 [Aspergillus insuetus]